MNQSRTVPRMHHRKGIYAAKAGEAYVSASGEIGSQLAQVYAPTAEEIVSMLTDLRLRQRWSRATAAAVLGVSKAVVRSWETGVRTPSGAAKRLIWLLHQQLTRTGGSLPNLEQIVTWGTAERAGV